MSEFNYELDTAAIAKLASQNVIVEKHDDRTTVTFMHDVELTSTGKDDAGKSLSVGKTPGRRVNIGYTSDGRGVWLQTHLACWKTPKADKPNATKTADEVAALREQVAALTAALTGGNVAPVAAPVAAPVEKQPLQMPAAPKSSSKGKSKGKSKSRRLPL
jgi:hypothetical protein